MPDNDAIMGIISVLSLFVVLPGLLVGGNLIGKWLKLKNAELEVRREELALQKQKMEYLTAEAQREALEKLDRLP